jgi:hypothetical protein
MLSKYDWFLSDCSDDQILFCHNYEYNRELQDYHLTSLAWREKAKEKTFDGFRQLFEATRLAFPPKSALNISGLFPFYFFPEWPHTPFLSINPPERRRRLDILYSRSKLRSHFALLYQYAAVKECAEQLSNSQGLPIVLAEDDFVFPLRFSIWESKEGWIRRVMDVAAYLDQKRARRWPEIKAVIDKKRSIHVSKASELKALGAFRLINYCGGLEQNGDLRGEVTQTAIEKCEAQNLGAPYGTHRRWKAAYVLARGVLDIYKRLLASTGVISPDRTE